MIFLHSVVFLAVCYYSGIGLVGLVSLARMKEKPIPGIHLVIPIAGLAFHHLGIWFGYLLFINWKTALAISLAVPTLTNVTFLYMYFFAGKRDQLRPVLEFQKEYVFPILLFAVVYLAAASPYILLGEKHFFLSSNQDIYDIIQKGNSILSNVPYDTDGTYSIYLGRMLDYWSNAIWTVMLNVDGLDAYVISTIIFLSMTVTSVYWLTRYCFSGGIVASVLASFWGVAASFYFSTYLASHRGSLIYGAVAPIFLGLVLLLLHKKLSLAWLVVVGILFYFLHSAYRGPLHFLLVPLMLLVIHEHVVIRFSLWSAFKSFVGISKENDIKLEIAGLRFGRLAVSVAALLASGFLLYNFTFHFLEPLRYVSLVRTDSSWKISKTLAICNIFWGIYPSTIFGSTNIAFYLVRIPSINIPALVASALMFLILLRSAIWSASEPSRRFFLFFVLLFPMFYYMMSNFYTDPVYVHKFLYTNYFLVVVCISLWLIESGLSTPFLRRATLLAFLSLIGILNVYWDISAVVAILKRDYHQKDSLERVIKLIEREETRDVGLDVPDFITFMAVNYVLNSRDIVKNNITKGFEEEGLTKRTYLLRVRENTYLIEKGNVDEDTCMFKGGAFSLSKHTLKNFGFIRINAWASSPRALNGISFAHVGSELSEVNRNISGLADDVVSFLAKSGMSNRTYVNVDNDRLYKILDYHARHLGVQFQPDPDKAEWFVQVSTGFRTTLEAQETRIFRYYGQRADISFTQPDDPRVVWKNDIYSIIDLPANHRKLINNSGIDFSPMIRLVKGRNQEVYLDMPPFSLQKLYLEKLLRSNGIDVTDSFRAPLICRFGILPYYASDLFRTVAHPREEVLWSSPPDSNLDRSYSIDLLTLPKDGREVISHPRLPSVPYGMLPYEPNWDFKVSFFGVTAHDICFRLLIAPGPSIDHRPFTMVVSSKDGKVQRRVNIVPPQTLVTLSLDEFLRDSLDGEILFESEGVIGKSLLPETEAILDYTILSPELTRNAEQLSDYTSRALNYPLQKTDYDDPLFDFLYKRSLASERKNIVMGSDAKKMSLGLGWYPLESYKGQTFRWVSDEAELILDSLDNRDRAIALDLEAGPGRGGAPVSLKVWHKNRLLNQYKISGRQFLKLELPDEVRASLLKPIVLRLEAETVNATSASDPRVLNFRVFAIKLSHE